jgi:hypothetical protein
MTKLTDAQVIEIRAAYPAASLRQLAKRFDVSRKAISVIVNNLSHKQPGGERSQQNGLLMRVDQMERQKTKSQITGTSVSELIRRAVDAWLRRPDMPQPTTLAEEIEAQDSATWHGDPDAGVPVEGRPTVGKPSVWSLIEAHQFSTSYGKR